MSVQTYLQILRDIKDVSFATVDDAGNPQVRIIDVMLVENEKLYFVVSRGKEFYQQLMQRPMVAVTTLTPDFKSVRIQGQVQKEDVSWLAKVFQENPSLNSIYPGQSRYILDVFSIFKGTGELFDLSVHPIHRESFAFGGEVIRPKGFFIESTCTQCGICKQNCPIGCIGKGAPYVIDAAHCLHCGLCYENCPAHAIRKLGQP